MTRLALALALLLAATPAFAEDGPAEPPPAPTGLDGASERDPALGRGLSLGGGVIDRAGTVSVGATSLALPLAGLASTRVSVHDRAEVFLQAGWALVPDVGNSAIWLAGVRAQAYRDDTVAVAVEGVAGQAFHDPDFQDSASSRAVELGGGVGATACLDGARCRLVTEGSVRFLAEVGAEDEYGRMAKNERLVMASAHLVAGHRWRAVAGGELLAEIGDDTEVALYAGGRYAHRWIAVDAGAVYVPGTVPLPIVGLSLRFR